ncbi:MAG: nucleoside phosphorylase [Clostridia bacterium]|nr:nucleoside phosphorylase [Clostridia bacterium]
MAELPPIAEYFDDDPIITPCAMHGDKQIKLDTQIETAICTFLCENIDRNLLESILADCRLLFYVYGRSGKVPVYLYRNQCVIVLMTVGSPVAAAVVEELKYLGIKNIIAYGTAGQLDESIPSDACVLIEKAIRDEGTSYHYLAPSLYVETDLQLTSWLEDFLQSGGMTVVRGVSWTTDALFRETQQRCARRKKQGAVTVEMECAGFAAACKRLQMRFAEFVFFSDTLSDTSKWQMIGAQKQFDARRSLKVTLLQALLSSVSKIKLPNC